MHLLWVFFLLVHVVSSMVTVNATTNDTREGIECYYLQGENIQPRACSSSDICLSWYEWNGSVWNPLFLSCVDPSSDSSVVIGCTRVSSSRNDLTVRCACETTHCNNITLPFFTDNVNTSVSTPTSHSMGPPSFPPTLVTNRTTTNNDINLVSLVSLVLVVLVPAAALVMYCYKRGTCISGRRAGRMETPTEGVVTLDRVLARGRFSTVYLGRRNRQFVAVKIFEAESIEYYEQEMRVYDVENFGNWNVLKRIGSTTLERRIILEYHDRGSLYSFLTVSTVTLAQFYKMTRALCSGIAHVHSRNVLHRNINSTTVTVKSDMSVCIGAFEISMLLDDSNLDRSTYHHVGATPRYLSPELLLGTNNMSRQELLLTDSYAMSLVLWEVLTRTVIDEEPGAYQLPFEEYNISGQPDLDVRDMAEIVCRRRLRPSIPTRFENNARFNQIIAALSTTWAESVDCRLSPGQFNDIIKANAFELRFSPMHWPESSV